MTLVLAILAASLLGSLHCAAMCSGFVCFYAGVGPTAIRGSQGFTAHAAYNTARLAAYLILGAAAGAAGASVDRSFAAPAGLRAAGLAAGVLMIVWGLARLAAEFGVRVPAIHGSSRAAALLGRTLARHRDHGPVARAALAGAVTGLLPCGWLYTFALTAAGTGSARTGAIVMLVFWAGTLPVLLTIAVGVQRLAGPFRRRLPALSASLLVALGALALSGRLRPLDGLPHTHGHPSAAEQVHGH